MWPLATSSTAADPHTHVLHVLQGCAGEGGTKQIMDIFDELSEKQRRSFHVADVKDLEAILRQSQLFDITTHEVTGLASVTLRTTLTFCAAHSARAGSCRDSACAELHFCVFFLLSGKCPFGDGCHFGHALGTEHNRRQLSAHGLSGLDVSKLRLLMCSSRARRGVACPKICRFYNTAGDCVKKGKCHCLHLCKYYVDGECKFSRNCKRNHNITDAQVLNILERYGVKTEGRPLSDVLEDLKSYDRTARQTQVPRATSEDWEPIGRPTFSRNSKEKDFPPPPFQTGFGRGAFWPGSDLNRSNTSSESENMEDGEIRDDSPQDDRPLRPASMPWWYENTRRRQESVGTSWEVTGADGNARPWISSCAEDEERGQKPLWMAGHSDNNERRGSTRMSERERFRIRHNSPGMSGDNSARQDGLLMADRGHESPERSHRRYESPQGSERGYDSPQRSERGYESPQRSERGYDSPQRSERGYESPQRSERGYGSPQRSERGYDSPQRSERGYESPQRSERGYESQQRSDRRYDSPRRSEDRQPDSPHPSNWGRHNSSLKSDRRYESPQLSENNGRYDSPQRPDWRRHDSALVSEEKYGSTQTTEDIGNNESSQPSRRRGHDLRSRLERRHGSTLMSEDNRNNDPRQRSRSRRQDLRSKLDRSYDSKQISEDSKRFFSIQKRQNRNYESQVSRLLEEEEEDEEEEEGDRRNSPQRRVYIAPYRKRRHESPDGPQEVRDTRPVSLYKPDDGKRSRGPPQRPNWLETRGRRISLLKTGWSENTDSAHPTPETSGIGRSGADPSFWRRHGGRSSHREEHVWNQRRSFRNSRRRR